MQLLVTPRCCVGSVNLTQEIIRISPQHCISDRGDRCTCSITVGNVATTLCVCAIQLILLTLSSKQTVYADHLGRLLTLRHATDMILSLPTDLKAHSSYQCSNPKPSSPYMSPCSQWDQRTTSNIGRTNGDHVRMRQLLVSCCKYPSTTRNACSSR